MWCRGLVLHVIAGSGSYHALRVPPIRFPAPQMKKNPARIVGRAFWIAGATREMTTRASGTIKRELLVSCAFPAIPRPGGTLGSDG